jgi:single-strand DNA-binding protein
VLIGRLTRDIELKHVGGDGVAVARFTLAVNRQFKRDEADFINIVAWRGLAENCANYLRKGSLVAVEGRIQTGKYENNEGRTVYTTDVVADDVRFLDSRNRDAGLGQQHKVDPFASNEVVKNDPFAGTGIGEQGASELPWE